MWNRTPPFVKLSLCTIFGVFVGGWLFSPKNTEPTDEMFATDHNVSTEYFCNYQRVLDGRNSDKSGARWGKCTKGMSHFIQGLRFAKSNEPSQALEHYMAAEAVFAEISDETLRLTTVAHIARLMEQIRAVEKRKELSHYLREGLATSSTRSFSNSRSVVPYGMSINRARYEIYRNQVLLLFKSGETQSALQWAQDFADSIHSTEPALDYKIITLIELSRVLSHFGHNKFALELAKEAHAILEEGPVDVFENGDEWTFIRAEALTALAKAYGPLDREKAVQYSLEAIAIFNRLGYERLGVKRSFEVKYKEK